MSSTRHHPMWTIAVVAAVVGALLVADPRPAAAAPANVQMPFPCGETWYASTYPGHIPANAVDWNLTTPDGGLPVLAGVAGTATVMPEAPDTYGKWVQVDAGGGWTFRYAHLSSVTVINGPVTAQTEIGRIGQTGDAHGDHLHYEQRLNNVTQPATFNGTPIAYQNGFPGLPYQSANCTAGVTGSRWLDGDFDGDGLADIAMVTPRGSTGFNVTVLRSTGSAYAYAGLWYHDTGIALADVKLLAGRFDGDARTDLALVTSRGAAGINVTTLLSTGSSFAYAGLWFFDTTTQFGNSQIHVGNVTGTAADSRDDLVLVTPRGSVGINVVPLLSSGSAFTHAGLWYYDTGLTFAGFRFAIGDYNGDGRDDLAQITSRGAAGINVVPMLSDGVGAFGYGGLWYYDTTTVFTNSEIYAGAVTADARDDLVLVTPRGASGINVVTLPSTGAAFGYGGLWMYDTAMTIGGYRILINNADANAGQDLVAITARGATGVNIGPWLSNGSNSFTHNGLRYYDTTVQL